MNEYERALELKEETIANRRFLHENAETGLHLPETKAFVMKKLKKLQQDIQHYVLADDFPYTTSKKG